MTQLRLLVDADGRLGLQTTDNSYFPVMRLEPEPLPALVPVVEKVSGKDDGDGHCERCGLSLAEDAENQVKHVCPPAFR